MGRRATVRAPRLPVGTGPWLNAPPPGDWRGGVTLVDFWTYSCINCLRTLPALRAWHATYAAVGLTILGVHTPEFPFEHQTENAARALRELAIEYPVVLDNDRAIWGAFANRAWPHRYLIDSAGRIVHDHAGEGGEVATERAIRAALTARDGALPLPTPVFLSSDGHTPLADPELADDSPGAVCTPGTPELFAGYYRGISGNAGGFREDAPADYADPGGHREGFIHLEGRWRVDADAAHFAGPGAGALRLAFRGTAPNIVMAPDAAGPVLVDVAVTTLEDRAPATREDVGGVRLVVDAPRLYRVPPEAWAVAEGADGLRLLTLRPASPGLAVYSFTFGACA